MLNFMFFLISEFIPAPGILTIHLLCTVVNNILLLFFKITLIRFCCCWGFLLFMPILTNIHQLERKVFVLSQHFFNNPRVLRVIIVLFVCRLFVCWLVKCGDFFLLLIFFSLLAKRSMKVLAKLCCFCKL